MEFIVSFKHPEQVIKEDDLKHCRVWTMDFSEQTRTPIEDTPDVTILPENNEIDINQQDKVNLFNNFKLNRPATIPKVVSTPVPEKEKSEQEDDTQSTEVSAPESVQEDPPSSVKSEELSPSAVEEPQVPVSVEIEEEVDPLEQISSIIKKLMEPINQKREKLVKVKDMILASVDVDEDIQPAVDNFTKQIEAQDRKQDEIREKIMTCF